jgi:hypothetical protein
MRLFVTVYKENRIGYLILIYPADQKSFFTARPTTRLAAINPKIPSKTGTAVIKKRLDPLVSTDDNRSATIKMNEVIVVGTEYFIIPKNNRIKNNPAQAMASTNK